MQGTSHIWLIETEHGWRWGRSEGRISEMRSGIARRSRCGPASIPAPGEADNRSSGRIRIRVDRESSRVNRGRF